MTDDIEILSLLLAAIAVLLAVFPIRAYFVERLWPFSISIEDTCPEVPTPLRYGVSVRIRSRTSRTGYFAFGAYEPSWNEPPDYNSPAFTFVRVPTGERQKYAILIVAPYEVGAWFIQLDFKLPVTNPFEILVTGMYETRGKASLMRAPHGRPSL